MQAYTLRSTSFYCNLSLHVVKGVHGYNPEILQPVTDAFKLGFWRPTGPCTVVEGSGLSIGQGRMLPTTQLLASIHEQRRCRESHGAPPVRMFTTTISFDDVVSSSAEWKGLP